MSRVDRRSFPLKDLARRKIQTGLTILSLAVCVSVTVFLLLFGQSLGVEVTSFTGGGLTVGFSNVSSRFIVVVVILNSAAGVLVAYFLITVTTSERVRDMGLMKALGCLTDVVYSYFATELLIIVLAGCTLGTIGGIVLNFASIGLMNLLGFHSSIKPFNSWLIILILLSFVFVTYILGMRRIIKAAGVETTKALSPLFVWRTTHRPGLGLMFSLRGGFVTKMALRDLVRRRRTSLQSVACLSAIMTLITLAVVGGVIANETTQSYVERAIGQNIILVAQDEMVEQYRNHLEKFFGKDQTEQVNYLDWKYVIPSRLISDLNVIDGVVKVDPRLVLESALYELPNVSPNPEDPEHYIVIGGHRFGRALIIGVHAEKIVNEWLILGERLNESDLDGGLIGDSLALTLFQNPLKQSFIVQNNKFKVVGVCLDPLNNGMVVYVPVDRLSSLVNYAGYNVLLVKIDSSNYSKTLNEIEAQTSKLGLTILELNEALERQKAFVNYIWSMMLSLSLFSFVNAVLSLMGYLMLSITGQHRDLGIMWVLGAKPNTVVKVILFETFLLVLVSGAIGLPVGVIIAFWFFIPEAVISTTATLSIVGLLSVLMSALCLSSLYPARKVTKAPITKTIY